MWVRGEDEGGLVGFSDFNNSGFGGSGQGLGFREVAVVVGLG